MGNKLSIPVLEDVLYRKAATKTQTKKGKSDRWDNVEEIFDVYPEANLEGKKVILIDDVITTGSTIEACANAIHKHKNVQLYILSMAFAEL
jgi:predicted amidophosphoribosyltransferase